MWYFSRTMRSRVCGSVSRLRHGVVVLLDFGMQAVDLVLQFGRTGVGVLVEEENEHDVAHGHDERQ